MEYIAIFAAAAGAYVFGAVWYMSLRNPWMKAAGITEEQVEGGAGKSPIPFIISAVMVIIVAATMQRIMAYLGIYGVADRGIIGFALGAFIVTPWIVTNYAYGMRPRNLTFIDGGYATIGCTIIGLVLGLLDT